MPTDPNEENAAGQSAAFCKQHILNNNEASIPDQPPAENSASAVDQIAELRGDQFVGLRYLIEHGHNRDHQTPYKSGSEAQFAAILQMLRAGCPTHTIEAVLLDKRFGISANSKVGKAKAQAARRDIDRAAAKLQSDADAAEKTKTDAATVSAAGADCAAVLAELNEQHFVSQEGGQHRIYTEDFDPELKRIVLLRSLRSDFWLAYADRFVQVSDAQGNLCQKPLSEWWITNPRRRQYKRIDFLPAADGQIDGVYNLWRGFKYKPRAGNWNRLRDHMLHIICRGDLVCFEYLLNWMAQRVQYRDDQGWSAVVLRGEEGVGKGIVADTFGDLFGQHYVHISNAKHLVGNFNMHLRDCLLLFADEAFWAGDKQGESTLKALVTERFMPIEGKGRDVVMGRNRVALIIATNSEWSIPAGPTARRYFALDVSNECKDDRAYFDAIVTELDAGGREAMLYDLLRLDISKFEVRSVPKTEELLRQKINSQGPEMSWWFDCLMAGRQLPSEDQWLMEELPVEKLHAAYVAHANKTGQRHRHLATRTTLRQFLNEVMPEEQPIVDYHPKLRVPDPYAHPSDPSPGSVEKQVHCYAMPGLAECRTAFDKHHGQPFQWPEIEAEDALLS